MASRRYQERSKHLFRYAQGFTIVVEMKPLYESPRDVETLTGPAFHWQEWASEEADSSGDELIAFTRPTRSTSSFPFMPW